MKTILLLLAVFLFFSCSTEKTKTKQYTPQQTSKTEIVTTSQETHIFHSVQTVYDEHIPILNTSVFMRTDDKSLADDVENMLIHYHKLFDANHYYYDDETSSIVKNLKIVNEYITSGNEIEIDQSLYELTAESIDIMKLTDGYFNVFLNPVSNLYKGKFTPLPIENDDPDKNLIENALKHVPTVKEASDFFSNISGTFLPSRNIKNDSKSFEINLGGIAKGYIAQKIYENHKDKTFLLNLGNSSIIASGKTYSIGVISPYNKAKVLFQIDLPNGMSVSTSSTTNNYYILADDSKTIRCHIINPFTGYSDNYFCSITIISDNAALADALSTALFNVGDKSKIMEIIKRVREKYSCFIEACFVQDESKENKTVSLLFTNGFESFVNETNLLRDESVASTNVLH